MKIVILDGYTAQPGDLSWQALEELGLPGPQKKPASA